MIEPRAMPAAEQIEADPPPRLSAVARLALLVSDKSLLRVSAKQDALVREFLGVVKAVAGEEQAMWLRSGRLLAWAKTQEVGKAGYSSWTAFMKEFSPWRGSRTRDYVRLVECRLDAIKEAVSNNVIDLTVAIRALRTLGPDASREAQLAWLAEATFATVPPRQPACMDVLSGDEMRRVLKARNLADKLIGWEAPVRAIDEFIFECHARQLTGQQILDRARAVPPKPDRLDKPVPDWRNDPSVSLLGPWVEPTDIEDAIAKLRAIELLLDQRRVLLAKAYALIRIHALWSCVPGCKSLAELCFVHLEISQRTFQRYVKEGMHHLWYPEVEKEIAEGRITADQAMFAMVRGGGETIQDWLELARRLGRAELQRAEEAERDRDARLRKDYAAAVDAARAVERIVDRVPTEVSPSHGATPIGVGTAALELPASPSGKAFGEATAIGGTAARVAGLLVMFGAMGPIQVALRDDARRRSQALEPERIFVPPKLLAAADYLLSVVTMTRQYGPRQVVEQDTWACQNPRCRRRTLRVNVHHIVERQHGGTDDPSNLVTLCPACHLRGVHSRQLVVARVDDLLVWAWPSSWRPSLPGRPSTGPPPRRGGRGGVVIMHSPCASGTAVGRSAPH